MSEESISPPTLKIFYVAFGLTQVCAVAFLWLLINLKAHELGGNESVYFWHALLASFGLIVLQGESFLIFRILRDVRKAVTKAAHAAVHLAAFASAVAALTLVFEKDGTFKIPHGTHGRLGLLSTVLFLIQYIVAFATLVAPGLALNIRARLLPIHVFGGVLIFLLSCGTVLLEIGGQSGDFQTTVALILFALLVGVCVSFAGFRRRTVRERSEGVYVN